MLKYEDVKALIRVKVEIVAQMAELCAANNAAKRQAFMTLYASLCALQKAERIAEREEAYHLGAEGARRCAADEYQRGARRVCTDQNIPVPAWVETLESELRERDRERRDAREPSLTFDCDTFNQQVH